jgi:hypothetical protein
MTATGRVLRGVNPTMLITGISRYTSLETRDYIILHPTPCLKRRGFVHVENQRSEEPDHLHKVLGTDICHV